MRTKKEIVFMNKYKLSADPMNIILQERQTITGNRGRPTIKQAGDIYWSNIAYFSNPQNALKYVIEKEIKEAWIDDLKELVKKISKLEESIDRLSLDLSPDNPR